MVLVLVVLVLVVLERQPSGASWSTATSVSQPVPRVGHFDGAQPRANSWTAATRTA